MTTLAEARDGLAGAITKGAGLRAVPYLTSTIAHPIAHVRIGSYDPRLVLGRAKTEFTFTVTVFVGSAAERAVQIKCDRLREPWGDESLVEAIETSANWDVDVDYAAVVLVGEPTEVTNGEETLMMFELDVEVVF